MILRRLGNKKAIAHKIISYFPAHKIYLEPFFGSGGIYFSKPLSKYNIVNDLDNDVFNLFKVVMNRKDDLLDLFKITPLSEKLFKYWVEEKETDDVKKALRFLYLSSFSILGKNGTFRLLHSNCIFKSDLEYLIIKTSDYFKSTIFRNVDFREFFNGINAGEKHIPNKHRFIYADPPYLGTTNNYSNSFTEGDSLDLFNILEGTGIKWAMSEFKHPFILEQVKKRNLNVNIIEDRKNLNNKKTEILITNYELMPTLF